MLCGSGLRTGHQPRDRRTNPVLAPATNPLGQGLSGDGAGVLNMRGRASVIGKFVAAITVVTAMSAIPAAHSSAAPSAQAVSGLTRVTAISPSNSNTSKQLAAVCPPGQRVVGGGAEVVQRSGPGGRSSSAAPPHRHRRPVCRRRSRGPDRLRRLLAPQGLRRVRRPAARAANHREHIPCELSPQQSVLGVCPAGQREVGFGGRINNGAGQVRLTDLYDFFGPPSCR